MAPRDPHDDTLFNPSTESPQATVVSRRDFLKTVGVAGAVTSIAGQGASAQEPAQRPRQGGPGRQPERLYTPIPQEVAGNLIKRGIVGYADHLRIQPGETIKFMVTSERPRHRADSIRLIHGDANPKGPGIKEVVVDSPANAEYPGKRQELPLGS